MLFIHFVFHFHPPPSSLFYNKIRRMAKGREEGDTPNPSPTHTQTQCNANNTANNVPTYTHEHGKRGLLNSNSITVLVVSCTRSLHVIRNGTRCKPLLTSGRSEMRPWTLPAGTQTLKGEI